MSDTSGGAGRLASALLVIAAIAGAVEAFFAVGYLIEWFRWAIELNQVKDASYAVQDLNVTSSAPVTGDLLGRAGIVTAEALIALATSVVACVALVLVRTGASSWSRAFAVIMATIRVILMAVVLGHWQLTWHRILEQSGWGGAMLASAAVQTLALLGCVAFSIRDARNA